MPPIKRKNRAYKKGQAYKDSRKFIIICEGKREASYFRYFHNRYQKLVVEILEPTDDFHGQSAPKKLTERANQYIVDEEWDDTLDDELWFIVDTDRWGGALHNLAHFCSNTRNWFLGNSNPCFEVWLFYHLDCRRISEFNSQNVKKMLNDQTKGGYNLQRYVLNIEAAIKCASRLDLHPDKNIADVGTTKVYQLGEKILELIPRIDGKLSLSTTDS